MEGSTVLSSVFTLNFNGSRENFRPKFAFVLTSKGHYQLIRNR